jgi:hypothetical protein
MKPVDPAASPFCSAEGGFWPITSTAQFSSRPLLVEPDMAELRLLLLDLDAEREGGQHIGELHVHRAQRNVTLTAHFK